jgi:hypothetical protein
VVGGWPVACRAASPLRASREREDLFSSMTMTWPNQSAAANRRPAGQLDGAGNLFATVAADRAFPAAVAELGR